MCRGRQEQPESVQWQRKWSNKQIGRFADGEIVIDINEDIRGKDLFIVQPTCPPNVNDNLMELMLMISTSRRASARRITAVIPYYGYARQDRKVRATRRDEE